MIVDDAGHIVSDINGKPAIATISEEAEDATGSASVSIVLRQIPFPGARGGFIAITDPATGILSDVLTFSGGDADFGLCSVADAARAAACIPLVDGFPVILPPASAIPETGQPQEVATFPSPSGIGEFHVIVQSSEPVPEPSTAALLVAGLGSMSVVRRRMQAALDSFH